MNYIKWVIAIIIIFTISYFGAYVAYGALMDNYTEPKDYGTSSLEVEPNYGKQSDQFHRPQEAHNINQLTDETL